MTSRTYDPRSRRLRAVPLVLSGLAVAGAAVLLTVLVVQGDAPMQRHVTVDAQDAFSVDIPDGCQMTAAAGDVDYRVFRVTCGAIDYAGVYVGNSANLTVPRSRVTRTDFHWPAQVQTWSLIVPGDQEKADRIAASVSVRAQNSVQGGERR
jgi:hypothetical protein